MIPIRILLLPPLLCACLLFAGCGEDQKSCAEQSAEECDVDRCGAIMALRLDAAADCLRPEVASCGAPPEQCDLVVVNARGPQGRCWKFTNGCVAEGFELSSECQMEFQGKTRCAP